MQRLNLDVVLAIDQYLRAKDSLAWLSTCHDLWRWRKEFRFHDYVDIRNILCCSYYDAFTNIYVRHLDYPFPKYVQTIHLTAILVTRYVDYGKLAHLSCLRKLVLWNTQHDVKNLPLGLRKLSLMPKLKGPYLVELPPQLYKLECGYEMLCQISQLSGFPDTLRKIICRFAEKYTEAADHACILPDGITDLKLINGCIKTVTWNHNLPLGLESLYVVGRLIVRDDFTQYRQLRKLTLFRVSDSVVWPENLSHLRIWHKFGFQGKLPHNLKKLHTQEFDGTKRDFSQLVGLNVEGFGVLHAKNIYHNLKQLSINICDTLDMAQLPELKIVRLGTVGEIRNLATSQIEILHLGSQIEILHLDEINNMVLCELPTGLKHLKLTKTNIELVDLPLGLQSIVMTEVSGFIGKFNPTLREISCVKSPHLALMSNLPAASLIKLAMDHHLIDIVAKSELPLLRHLRLLPDSYPMRLAAWLPNPDVKICILVNKMQTTNIDITDCPTHNIRYRRFSSLSRNKHHD